MILLNINMNIFSIMIMEPRRAYKASLTSEEMGGERIRGTGVTIKTLAKVLMVMLMKICICRRHSRGVEEPYLYLCLQLYSYLYLHMYLYLPAP